MLGEKFLQKINSLKKKPKRLNVSLLSLLESYDSMLHTLKVLKPGERIIRADIDTKNGLDENDLHIIIHTKQGGTV